MATKEEETRRARKNAVGKSQGVSMEEIRRRYRDMTCKETKRGGRVALGIIMWRGINTGL